MMFIFALWGVAGYVRTDFLSPAAQEQYQLRTLLPHIPWYWLVIIFLTITLISVLQGSYEFYKKMRTRIEAEVAKQARPQITITTKEAFLYRGYNTADCFIHMTIHNASPEVKTLISDYQVQLMYEDKSYSGEIANLGDFFVIDQQEQFQTTENGEEYYWAEIDRTKLTDIRSTITPDKPLIAGFPAEGWLRAWLQGIPAVEAKMDGDLILSYNPPIPLKGVVTLIDAYGVRHSCTIDQFRLSNDEPRIIKRIRNS